MKIFIKLFTVLLSGFLLETADGGLPSLFPVCLRNDPQLNQCVIQSIKSLQSRFPSGDLGPGFKIPPAEPFFIPRLEYGSLAYVRTILTNIYISGISRMNIERLAVDINSLKFDMIISFPRLDIQAQYHLTLGLIIQPALQRSSSGNVVGRYDNTKIRVIMQARKYLRNGIEYIKFDPIIFKFINSSVGDLRFSNFFEYSPFTGQLVKAYLTTNRDYIATYINPDLEMVFSEIFTGVANKVADQASFDELFPQ